jgi:hypothetical protein
MRQREQIIWGNRHGGSGTRPRSFEEIRNDPVVVRRMSRLKVWYDSNLARYRRRALDLYSDEEL